MEYAGESFLDSMMVLSVPDLTPDCARDIWTVRGLTKPDAIAGSPVNPNYDALISTEPDRNLVGNILGCFEEMFNKVLINHRQKPLGYVMNNVQWVTSIWNTHFDVLRTISAVSVTGSGNLQITNPYGLPLDVAPMHWRDFDSLVPKEGDITVNSLAVWNVEGESGIQEHVTGARVALIPSTPDWWAPVKEKTQYLTDIIMGYSGKEQRIALRMLPRTRIEYSMLPEDKKNAAAMEALLFGNFSRLFCIPFWPDARKLTSSVQQGDTAIYFDTTRAKFRAGGAVIIWRGYFSVEAANIATVADNGITLTAPINAAWPADSITFVVPGLTGILEGEATLGRLSSSIFDGTLAFLCDPAPDVAAAAPTLHYGYDVIPWQPNLAGDRSQSYSGNIRPLDFSIGRQTQVDRSGVAIGQARGYLLTLENRAEIAAFRAWLALRKGRQKAFWMPTWQNDLILAAPTAMGEPTLVIQKTRYTVFQFVKPARRYLAIRMLDGSGQVFYRKVVASSEGETIETLTLDAFLSNTLEVLPGMAMVSFLNLVRLDDDETEMAWQARDVVEVNLNLVELPLEVSA